MPWTDVLPTFEYTPGRSATSTLVFAPETTRILFIAKQLLESGHAVMLAGFAGTGKSVLIRHFLDSLNYNDYLYRAMNFNYYTTSASLQAFLESAIEMKSGKLYAPPLQKKCIYFINDMNMPAIDRFGTQSPMTLLRQHMDYQHWHDRQAMTNEDVKGVNYVACMNPTAGSFTINPRLHRHFSKFSLGIPSDASVKLILSSMFIGRLEHYGFTAGVQAIGPKALEAAIGLHTEIVKTFILTAIRFHYNFNMRDLCQVLQSLLRASPTVVRSPELMVRVFGTEAIRVYADRLIDLADFPTSEGHLRYVSSQILRGPRRFAGPSRRKDVLCLCTRWRRCQFRGERLCANGHSGACYECDWLSIEDLQRDASGDELGSFQGRN
jgi:dynein heavy chain